MMSAWRSETRSAAWSVNLWEPVNGGHNRCQHALSGVRRAASGERRATAAHIPALPLAQSNKVPLTLVGVADGDGVGA